MKQLLFTLAFFGLSFSSFAQDGFKWSYVDSSSNKTKSELYSLTKMFIAKYWKSAKTVIQNDDKENGIIMLKGVITERVEGYGASTYDYSYMVTFRCKDGKYKVEIGDVYCDKAYSGGMRTDCVQPCEGKNCKGVFDHLVSRKGVNKMMNRLKAELSEIINKHKDYIYSNSIANDGF